MYVHVQYMYIYTCAFSYLLVHIHVDEYACTFTCTCVYMYMYKHVCVNVFSVALFFQISAGVRHCLALDTPPPIRGDVMFAVPLSIPARYPALRDTPCKAIHARLMLLNHFAKLMIASWKLFSIQNVRVCVA